MTTSMVRNAWVAALALLSVSGAVAAEPRKYEVTGFREVRFGMPKADVGTPAAKSFGLRAIDRVRRQIPGREGWQADLVTGAKGPAETDHQLHRRPRKSRRREDREGQVLSLAEILEIAASLSHAVSQRQSISL